MKRFLIPFTTFLAAICLVQEAFSAPPSPQGEQVELSVKTDDMTDIEVRDGLLLFSTGGRRFEYTSRGTVAEAPSAAAALATLSELRHATTVSLWVRLKADPTAPSEVEAIAFKYRSLKQ